MEIDKRQLRECVLWLIDMIYQARKELVAYQVAHTLLSADGLAREFDQFLDQSRKNSSPALLADHQKARDTIERLLSEKRFDAALEFLRQWKPKGPIQ